MYPIYLIYPINPIYPIYVKAKPDKYNFKS